MGTSTPEHTEQWNEIVKAMKLFAVAVVVLYLSTILLIITGYTLNKHRAREGQKALAGVCTLYFDFKTRIAVSKQFLKDHPTGIAGFKKADIERGIKQMEKTIQSLSTSDCPPP